MSTLIQTIRPPVSIDALRLAEDIQSLAQIMWSLGNIDPCNITDDAEMGRTILRVTLQQVRHCKMYAEAKMRREFLSTHRKKIERQKGSKVKR